MRKMGYQMQSHRRGKVRNASQDKRVFAGSADWTRAENFRKLPMRGGYRL